MSQTLVKLSSTQLPTLLPRLSLAAEPNAALQNAQLVSEALDRLEAGGFLLEATRLMAHALPKREAVWWACMCAAHTAPPDLSENDRKARETAEHWVRQQTDQVRRAGMQLAEAGGFTTPEAWTAVAAFWSGDSMAPEGQPAVPPGPHLTGMAVAGCVALAAVRGDPTKQQARLKQFLESGRNIAAGGPGRLPPEQA